MKKWQLEKEPVEAVLGFGNMVARQIEHINKLFAECKVPPTADEKAAGVERLDFGDFGLIDWYAQRMHITTHEEAEKTPWIIVWQCMRNDAQKTLYERRLAKVRSNKKK